MEKVSSSEAELNSGDWRDFIDTEEGITWKVGRLTFKFAITFTTELPSDAKLLKEASFEDHTERLLIDSHGKWYRNAGGGRGFYWTQLLELVGVEE